MAYVGTYRQVRDTAALSVTQHRHVPGVTEGVGSVIEVYRRALPG